VKRFSGSLPGTFFNQFSKSFILMTEIGVFMGSQGKILEYLFLRLEDRSYSTYTCYSYTNDCVNFIQLFLIL